MLNHCYFLPVLLWLLGASCGLSERSPAAIPTGLSGSISGITDSTLAIECGDQTFEVMVRQDRFELELPIYDPCYATVKGFDWSLPIYLLPGESLHMDISLDQKSVSSKYEGRAAAANQYLLAHKKFTEVNRPSLDTVWEGDEMKLKQVLRRFRSKENAFHKKYLRENINLDPHFMTGEKARILYRWGSRLHRFYSHHRDLTKRPPTLSTGKSFDYKDELSLNEGRFIGLPEYDAYVQSVVIQEVSNRAQEIENYTYADAAFEEIHKIEDQDVKDYALEVAMRQILINERYTEGELATLMDQFLAACQNGDRIYRIQNLYDQWLRIQPGRKIPDLSLNQGSMQLPLTQGKLNYIYVCTEVNQMDPDLTTMPDDPQLQILEVVAKSGVPSVTLQTKHTGSKKAIQQAIITKEDLSTLQHLFMKSHAPFALIVDGHGRIIDYDAALPDDPELYAFLDRLTKAS